MRTFNWIHDKNSNPRLGILARISLRGEITSIVRQLVPSAGSARRADPTIPLEHQPDIQALSVANVVANITLGGDYPSFACNLSFPIEDAALFRIGERIRITLESEP